MVRAVSGALGVFFPRSRDVDMGVGTMANGTHSNGRGEDGRTDKPSAEETALSARLDRLEDQLSESRKGRHIRTDQSESAGNNASAKASAMARGFRLSSELVAGVLVGAVIGWGIDQLLSTSPWGLIVFFLLGFVAGVINVMRAAGVTSNGTTDRS
jgi:ATP synthase protein I